jgi:hypothetical protein
VTLSQDQQSTPSNDPTVKFRPVTPAASASTSASSSARKPQRSTLRRIARRIVGPTLMTRKN